jgi:hypothetical protein
MKDFSEILQAEISNFDRVPAIPYYLSLLIREIIPLSPRLFLLKFNDFSSRWLNMIIKLSTPY